jgi:hypothetical protein
MKIILINKSKLRFTEMYLFKDNELKEKLEDISYQQIPLTILSTSDSIDTIVVYLAKQISRLDVIKNLYKTAKPFKYFLYNFFITEITVGTKPNGNPKYYTHILDETASKDIKSLIQKIKK